MTEKQSSILAQHPLQRLSSPSRGISAAIHTLGLCSFGLSFHWLSTHPNRINAAYGWHFQFLTIIGLSLAALTFGVGLLADVSVLATDDQRLKNGLFRTKNVLSVCSAPLALLISTLYWGLRAVDPALVVPPDMGLPVLPDLGFHAAPAMWLLIDLLLLSPPWTIAFGPAVALSGAIAVAYWAWIERCFARNGFYPYPLFELLDSNQRAALFAGSALAMAASTVVLKSLYARLNGRSGSRLIDRKAQMGK